MAADALRRLLREIESVKSSTSVRRRLAVALAVVILTRGALGAPPATAAESPPPLPPLADPATLVERPGKIVWSDLFVDDVARVRDFYTRLFGWSWRWVGGDDRRYGLLLRDGIPVAGIARLAPEDAPRPYGRWVHYLSAPDVGAVTDATLASGGRVLLAPRTFPERGEFSILADSEGAIFGVLDSASGDPEDYRAETGDWLWHVLFSRNMNSAALFYEERFGYELFEYEWEPGVPRLLLASQGYARASVSPMPEDREDARAAWVGFVRVADVPAATARAESLGAEVLLAPSPDTHDNGIAIIADPQGGVIGLLHWVFKDDGEVGP